MTTRTQVRSYGSSGPQVILVHGGPGAPGHMAPVARGLEGRFRVLEPFQRGSGGEPLSVARHVEDLSELVDTRCDGGRPALVGSSWGAMLTLAFAAAHPGLAGPLVLVGCGTFDPIARARMREILDERMDEALRRRLDGLDREFPDPDARLAAMADLIVPLFACDQFPGEPGGAEDPVEPCDARANEETWNDMLRLQEEGVYPAALRAIESPVLMLHGAFDPHPGRMIRASLEPHLRRLEYVEWERCGHYPWLERAVREEFFPCLGRWLEEHTGSPPC